MAKGKHVFAVNKHFVLWQTKRPAWAWLGWLLLPAKRKHGWSSTHASLSPQVLGPITACGQLLQVLASAIAWPHYSTQVFPHLGASRDMGLVHTLLPTSFELVAWAWTITHTFVHLAFWKAMGAMLAGWLHQSIECYLVACLHNTRHMFTAAEILFCAASLAWAL